MTAEVLVSFQGVCKSYDGQLRVVDSLDLEIRKGEFLTLLGPSGSGKTTTLMMLAGFEHPDAGRILLDGQAIERQPPEKRNIGMVFQNYALFPHMTVAENIAYPLRVRRLGRAEIERRVAEALEVVRLDKLAARKPAALSGGQQQRVALARALVFEPRLVLMDEPLGALDKQLREELQLEIKHIQQRLALTILYVTHDQAEALTMSDRIAVFDAGRIQQLGRPRAIYDTPATAFVATFIGDNNLIPGTTEAVADGMAQVRLASGERLTATATQHAVAGAPITLAVRPERIRLAPDASCDNRLTGTVREVIYVGDQTRIAIDLPLGRSLTARVANTEIRDDPAPGSAVEIGWRSADCAALDVQNSP